MTAYVLGGPAHAEHLATTPGARILVDATGRWLPLFFAGLGTFLAALAWGSSRRRRWSWYGAVVAYSIGVGGSAWEIAIGIGPAWLSLAINAAVVATLASRGVRAAFLDRLPRGAASPADS